MFHHVSFLPAVALSLGLSLLPGAVQSQGYPTTAGGTRNAAETARRFGAVAPRLVESAGIKQGDLVTIYGGPALIAEMEALGVEVQNRGGRPILIVDSPTLTRNLFTKVPARYLDGRPSPLESFEARNVAVVFVLPSGEDFATVRNADPDRFKLVTEALAKSDAATAAERNQAQTRVLVIGVPTPSDTASIQMDYAPYAAMNWSAIESDYKSIAARGEKIKQVIEGAKRVHITSPEGTDFTVEVGGRPVVVSAGIPARGTKGSLAARSGSLPGGRVSFAPIETSATGKLRAAEDQCTNPIKDEALEVEKGMPLNIRAGSDEECLKESFKNAGRFGSIVIGLNPAIKYEHVPSYGPQLENSAGVVSIGFGNNRDLGGVNPTVGGGWTVPLLRATVEADGKVIVRDGQLAF